MLDKSPGLSIFQHEHKVMLSQSVKQKYPFIGRVNFYHPILSLYNKTNLHHKRLNHKYSALEIGDTLHKINESLRIAKLKININNKIDKTQWRHAVIKELPLIPLKHTGLLKTSSQEPLRMKSSNFLIFNNLYSISNSVYIENISQFLMQ